MRTLVDRRLLEQARQLRFRFACEDCAHFSADDDQCSLGYHAAPRRAELEIDGSARSTASLELCKTFELA